MATFNHREPRFSMLTICPLPDHSGLVLAGEADLTVKDMLRAALAALPGAGEIRLDLASLRFIDVACTRELVALTARHPAVRLIICHPPAELLRIIELAYPDAAVEFTGTPGPHSPHAGQYQAARGDGRDGTSTPDGSRRPGPQPRARDQRPGGISTTIRPGSALPQPQS